MPGRPGISLNRPDFLGPFFSQNLKPMLFGVLSGSRQPFLTVWRNQTDRQPDLSIR